MRKVIVFDLDDTLYDEYEYVKSGFQAVSEYLWREFGFDTNETYNRMWNSLKCEGRGTIFDGLLKYFGITQRKYVKKCLSVYRLHQPEIILPKESNEILRQLHKKVPLYLVTDGNKVVQANKIYALRLEMYMKKCYITYRYGHAKSKPSPYCFQLIAKSEGVSTADIVYIGDNPKKDFVGIKPLGFRTIRVMTGQHSQVEMPIQYEAELRINHISDLIPALKQIWCNFVIEG
ncbi:haloacid dehalogenase [Paenibacillus montaniterrae]|uniref:Haloacid dehalogenase n=1 Tax=Paenibacillus montaniterrae TaxID=429341 RepID=A0A919YW02_9BACL|nr:HAD family hydrolase [Paenibacillus montaniterrae]GIP19114.1 haloacid dehalogenase [Paenibacillus montaniterrae]